MKKIFILITILTLIICVDLCSSINIYAFSENQNDLYDIEEDVTEEDEYSTRSVPGGEVVDGEEWYRIELDEYGRPIMENPIDYSEKPELLSYLKPGDIVYERNNAVSLADWTGHIAMVVDVFVGDDGNPAYILMIEVVLDGGVIYGLMTPSRFIEKQVSIMRVKNATNEQIQGAIEWAINQKDKPWLLVPTKSSSEDAGDWYCSELIWAAYYHQGIHLDEDDLSPVPPNEIYERNEVATILDYRADTEDYYDTKFINKTDTHHTYSCDGDTYTEEHDYEEYGTCHEKCRACGYERFKGVHSYTSEYRKMNSSTHHYAYCECGEMTVAEHRFYTLFQEKICFDCDYRIDINHIHSYTYIPMGFNSHKKTCSCGDTVRESCVGYSSIDGTSHCMRCGQELNSNIGLLNIDLDEAILPSSKEDEEY